MSTNTESDADDIVWGVAAISGAINRTPRQVFHMLRQGQLPAVRKIGNHWVASRRKLLAALTGEAA